MKKLLILCFGLLCLHFSAQAQTLTPDMVDMTDTSVKLFKLKVGQTAYVQYRLNGSTGAHGEVKSNDESILKLTDSYPKEDGEKETVEIVGGADLDKTVIFKALKKGKTSVVIKEMFRGEVKNTRTIEVVVK